MARQLGALEVISNEDVQAVFGAEALVVPHPNNGLPTILAVTGEPASCGASVVPRNQRCT